MKVAGFTFEQLQWLVVFLNYNIVELGRYGVKPRPHPPRNGKSPNGKDDNNPKNRRTPACPFFPMLYQSSSPEANPDMLNTLEGNAAFHSKCAAVFLPGFYLRARFLTFTLSENRPSQTRRMGLATKIEEYVPTKIPTSKANAKS